MTATRPVDAGPMGEQPTASELPTTDPAAGRAPWRRRVRQVAGVVLTVLAALLVWYALVAPDQPARLGALALLRIPVEGLVLVAVLLALPARARRYVVVPAGALLGVLLLVKLLDLGFYSALDRPFDAVNDWGYFGPAIGVLRDSVGGVAVVVEVLAVLLVACVPVLMIFALRRLSRLAARHRTASVRTVAALTVLWVACAGLGVRFVAGTPVASTSAAALTYDQVRMARSGVKDQTAFASEVAVDKFRHAPADQLLTGLRGKDVIVAFVESYGRVAVQDSSFSPQVDTVLDAGTRRLQAAGFDARSAFLTSPTFGGVSWLAHSTFQSGVWINSQTRYDRLVSGDRFTLNQAFKRAGWRTVDDVPSNQKDWPQGTSFYHYDMIYNKANVGYQGPTFSYASMPDQYVLSAFHRLELTPGHAPLMAEIDLVSSHTPWAPLPRMVDWGKVGDGSIFKGMEDEGPRPDALWRDADQVRAAYGQSVQYTMNTLVSFVETYADPNLVLVVLGDHQPATIVSGSGAGHDVPISVIAHDPSVLDRISGWGWQPGLRPSPDAPVWPMSSFRDRFLTAYGG